MPTRLRSALKKLLKPQSSTTKNEHLDHLDVNRRYWDAYAGRWTKEFRGYEETATETLPESYEYLGDEWGHPHHLNTVLEEFIYPYVGERTVAVEIGSGGGRVAGRIAPKVKHLYCLDISREMLNQARAALRGQDNVTFMHVEDPVFPESVVSAQPDFIYSFDVFVHLDLHTMWKYLVQIATALPVGGTTFLHTSNLLTEAGWSRFASQSEYSLEGHYFITPDVLKTVATHAGLHVLKEGSEDSTNFYKARDYLVLFRK